MSRQYYQCDAGEGMLWMMPNSGTGSVQKARMTVLTEVEAITDPTLRCATSFQW
jgi:hypothetical protein